jgi:hypothetical protein
MAPTLAATAGLLHPCLVLQQLPLVLLLEV